MNALIIHPISGNILCSISHKHIANTKIKGYPKVKQFRQVLMGNLLTLKIN